MANQDSKYCRKNCGFHPGFNLGKPMGVIISECGLFGERVKLESDSRGFIPVEGCPKVKKGAEAKTSG